MELLRQSSATPLLLPVLCGPQADFLCSTLLELELVDAEVLAQIRTLFYRLDTRAAGFLSTEGFMNMMRIQKGGARSRCE